MSHSSSFRKFAPRLGPVVQSIFSSTRSSVEDSLSHTLLTDCFAMIFLLKKKTVENSCPTKAARKCFGKKWRFAYNTFGNITPRSLGVLGWCHGAG